MNEVPAWLTDEGIERTMALGREMVTFLELRSEAKALDPDAKVEPHPELLALIAAIKSKHKSPNVPAKDWVA